MAYIGETGDGSSYYALNHAVGDRSPNRRDDILLVQWLLHRVYADHPLFTAPPPGDITVDGLVGPQTVAWIAAFQADVCRLGLSCTVDGRVDAAPKATVGDSRTPYTILWLNAALRAANPATFEDPASDPDLPPELISALQTNADAAGSCVDTIADIQIRATTAT